MINDTTTNRISNANFMWWHPNSWPTQGKLDSGMRAIDVCYVHIFIYIKLSIHVKNVSNWVLESFKKISSWRLKNRNCMHDYMRPIVFKWNTTTCDRSWGDDDVSYISHRSVWFKEFSGHNYSRALKTI